MKNFANALGIEHMAEEEPKQEMLLPIYRLLLRRNGKTKAVSNKSIPNGIEYRSLVALPKSWKSMLLKAH